MKLEFTSGASVSRVYDNCNSVELIAGFQYSNDAVEFAKTKLAEDAERKWLGSFYVVCNAYDGTLKVFKHEPAEKAKAA